MTVSVTDAASGPFYPNGATVAFPFDFGVEDRAEVRVFRINADGTEETISNAVYTVTIAVGGEGGTVTMAAPPPADGRPLWVAMDPSFEQEILFEDEGPFNSAVLNPLADRAARRTIWLRDRLARAFRLPFGEAAADIPLAIFRTGGKVLGFNAVTGALEVQGSGAFKGDPGGNVMAIGLFTQAPTLSIPLGTNSVQTSGFSATGMGRATYIADAAVNPAYVANNPRASFMSANGRGFRISEQIVAPEMFGAVGNLITDDFAACDAWSKLIGGGVWGRVNRMHLLSQCVFITDRDNFKVFGTGGFKMANGTPVDYGYAALWFGRCTDFAIEDIRLDGNRAGRVPREADCHTLTITESHRWVVRRVRSDNACCDGFIVKSDTEVNSATHPADWMLEDCSADNCFRQGLSVVHGRRGVIRRFRGTNTNGTAPESCIDLETDNGAPDNTIQNITLEDCYSEGNNGHGFMVAPVRKPINISIIRCRSVNDKKGGIVAGFKGGVIDSPIIEGYKDNMAADALAGIYVPPGSDYGDFRINTPKFRQSSNVNRPLISSNADDVIIEGLNADNCGLVAALYGKRNQLINATLIQPTLYNNNGAIAVFGDTCEVSGNRIVNWNHAVIYAEAVDFTARNNRLTSSNLFTEGDAGAIRCILPRARIVGNYIAKSGSPINAPGMYIDAAADEVSSNILEGFTQGIYFGAAPKIKRGNLSNGAVLSETGIQA